MRMTEEVKEKLKEYARQKRMAKRLGFTDRRVMYAELRAAALGDVEAVARLDERFPEWRDLLGPSTVTGSGG